MAKELSRFQLSRMVGKIEETCSSFWIEENQKHASTLSLNVT